MTTEIKTLDNLIIYDEKLIKKTLAPGLTEQEFSLYMQYVYATKLDPFKREIWAIKPDPYTNKYGKLITPPAQIMIGLNGYLSIANSYPEYDNFETSWEHDKNGVIISCTVKIYRKDRTRPIIVTVFYKEFCKTGTWDKMPHVMIEKVALSHGIRRAFPTLLNGTYTPEEMPPEYDISKVIEGESEVVPPQEPPKIEKSLEQMVYDELAWGYVIKHDSRAIIKDYLLKTRTPYFFDKANNYNWFKEEVPELKEFCIFNPIEHAENLSLNINPEIVIDTVGEIEKMKEMINE